MPTKIKRSTKRRALSKVSTSKTPSSPKAPNQRMPRCAKCGSKTIRLEQLHQELLVVLAIHCLICGNHTFIGKPSVRLIRRPEIPDSGTPKNLSLPL